MTFKPTGRIISVISFSPENAISGIVSPLVTTTFFTLAPFNAFIADVGSETLANLGQSLKIPSPPMLVVSAGMVTSVSSSHPKKADFPILVTPLGIFISVILSQS